MISVQCSECQSDRNSDKRASAAGATTNLRRYPNAWTLAVDHVHVCNKEIVIVPLAFKRNHSHRERPGRPCISRVHSFTCATATLCSVFVWMLDLRRETSTLVDLPVLEHLARTTLVFVGAPLYRVCTVVDVAPRTRCDIDTCRKRILTSTSNRLHTCLPSPVDQRKA